MNKEQNVGLPINMRMVPLRAKDVPMKCFIAAQHAFETASKRHGFYESCYSAYHAFLDKLEETQDV